MWGVLESQCAFLCSAEVTESVLNGVIVFCADFIISPVSRRHILDLHAGSEVGNWTYHTPTAQCPFVSQFFPIGPEFPLQNSAKGVVTSI